MVRPILYLTNAASVAAVRRGKARPEVAASVGPGSVWTIMARPRPRYGECGDGVVAALAPAVEDLAALLDCRINSIEYRRRYVVGLDDVRDYLTPGKLMAEGETDADADETGPAPYFIPVWDGDTLICACARDAALDDRCHTSWAAKALDAAGWDVRLHGLTLAEVRAWRRRR